MIPQNFTLVELSCKCENLACPARAESAFEFTALMKLQTLRIMRGIPLAIHSGARCPKHNLEVGGVKESLHVADPGAARKCSAFDIGAVNANDRFLLVRDAIKSGFTGIGIAETFVHVDTRAGVPVLWTYSK